MPESPRPPAARLANAGMVLAHLFGALVGAGTLYLVGTAAYFILPELGRMRAGAGPWWMAALFYTAFFGCLVLGLGITGGCLYGAVRRVRGGGRTRPRSLAAGPRFADRLRGLLLGGMSLVLGVFVSWTGYVMLSMWRAGAFGPTADLVTNPEFYVIGGAWTFGATASASGAIAAARRLLAPPDRPAG